MNIAMDLAGYLAIREALRDHGYAEEYEWSESIKPPETAEALWREYAFVVINSGMKAQIAGDIWARVRPVVERGGNAEDAFGHLGKAAAINDFWECRDTRLELSRQYQARSEKELLDWCARLSWIGPITKYHLGKNIGAEVAKPDRWLKRVAEVTNETCQGLCERLATESGDRVATVDLIIWRACNLRILKP